MCKRVGNSSKNGNAAWREKQKRLKREQEREAPSVLPQNRSKNGTQIETQNASKNAKLLPQNASKSVTSMPKLSLISWLQKETLPLMEQFELGTRRRCVCQQPGARVNNLLLPSSIAMKQMKSMKLPWSYARCYTLLFHWISWQEMMFNIWIYRTQSDLGLRRRRCCIETLTHRHTPSLIWRSCKVGVQGLHEMWKHPWRGISARIPGNWKWRWLCSSYG